MTPNQLADLARSIVAEARRLHLAHTHLADAPVNYACVFSQSDDEYKALVDAASRLGHVASETATGPVFKVPPIATEAGDLRLLKIRRSDSKRPERGDADFTIPDYDEFKKSHLGEPGWGLLERPEMEMLELADPAFDVLAYYSHPILAEVLKLDLSDTA